MKKLILTIAVLLSFLALSAQEKTPFNKWEIGVNGGVGNFSGEYNKNLKSTYDWDSQGKFGFGATLKKNFTHVFALELDWNQNNLLGGNNYHGFDPPYSTQKFRTLTNEYDLNSVWNVNNLFSKNKFDRKVFLFAKAGVGVTHFNNKEGVVTGTKSEFTIPVGGGVGVKLSDKVRLNVGTQWSFVNTDRLDGLVSNQKPTYGTKLYTYAGLSFTIGKKKKVEPPVVIPIPVEPKPEPKPEPVKIAAPVKAPVLGNIYKVFFAFDKFNLDVKATTELDKLANDLNENPSVNVSVKSHTDSRGPSTYNMKLSERRGKSVIDYLVSKGVNISRINAQAFGETQLVNKCKDGVPCTEAEHALNRRTETVVIE